MQGPGKKHEQLNKICWGGNVHIVFGWQSQNQLLQSVSRGNDGRNKRIKFYDDRLLQRKTFTFGMNRGLRLPRVFLSARFDLYHFAHKPKVRITLRTLVFANHQTNRRDYVHTKPCLRVRSKSLRCQILSHRLIKVIHNWEIVTLKIKTSFNCFYIKVRFDPISDQNLTPWYLIVFISEYRVLTVFWENKSHNHD